MTSKIKQLPVKSKSKSKHMPNIVQIDKITEKIYLIRGVKVMLDKDLAALYGVENKVLKQAVRRNIDRFPFDFMFELSKKEYQSLRSQNVTLKRGQHSKYPPFVFTEQGVAMLSSVLKSKKAVHVNIQIMRAFIIMRKMSISDDQLNQKIIALEQKYDKQFQIVFEAIEQLLVQDEKPKRKIGYVKAPKMLPVKRNKQFVRSEICSHSKS